MNDTEKELLEIRTWKQDAIKNLSRWNQIADFVSRDMPIQKINESISEEILNRLKKLKAIQDILK